jgi:hypothetical protein
MKLQELLKPTWDGLKTYSYGGKTYYLGCEVIGMLGLSSITSAMGRKSIPPKVSSHNWMYKMVPAINKNRSVILITINGIVEMIQNNDNQICKRLKMHLAE